MYRLHYWPTPNGHKVTLFLEEMGLPYEIVPVNIRAGDQFRPDFLKIAPNNRMPALEDLADGVHLFESGAILLYLADKHEAFIAPASQAQKRAEVLQWLFFEQYSHEPCIAVSRFIRKYLPPDHPRRSTLDALHASGNEALAAMERHLARLPWFGGERYSIADIALFAYTHVADEAGIDLGAYARIERWLKHVMQTPGFVPMRND